MRNAPFNTAIAGKFRVAAVWWQWFLSLGKQVDANEDDIDDLESGKADKVTGGTTGNLASLNKTGGFADSGKVPPTGTIVGTTDTQTLSNKTLSTPSIANFTNATHDHSNAANGGVLYGYSGSFQMVSDMRNNAGTHQKKTRTLTFTGGLLTDAGTESAWTAI